MPQATTAACCALALAAALPVASAQSQCSASSPQRTTPLVELYTSEGCSSCPPADRWLSRLKGRDDVVAVAFHVHYWDHLGWRDRFGSSAHTERQAQQRAVNGAPYSYTPQVVIGGIDRPDWHRLATLPAPGAARAPVAITLAREGSGFSARVDSLDGAPAQLSGWWAVTEDGHQSAVRAGENSGSTLAHDFVVREQRAISAWNARPGQPVALRFEPRTPADPAHPRRIVLVVTDTAGRPLQALQLAC